MSTVYLAVRDDDAFQRQVAVKLIRRGMESKSILRRMKIERQILASLDHPNIARLYDGGSTQDGLPYFVMEFVDGVSIETFCEEEGLSVAQRLELFLKVCSAVQYAHQNLVVHRDIKPSNIVVGPTGEPKLLDFGIAKLLNPELVFGENYPTSSWERILTPSFASPEHIAAEAITTASDIYSLGVLLYKLLTGRLPRDFEGHTPTEIERLLSETEPLSPSTAVALSPDGKSNGEGPDMERTSRHQGSQASSLSRELAGDLDAIVLKTLRSKPQQRYASVERLAEDLERYLGGLPVSARAGSRRYRAAKFLRRNRWRVAVAAGVMVLLIGFAAAMAFQSARVTRERDQARLESTKKQEVLALMLEVFEFSNPYVLPGQELTVREALERSVPVFESRLKDQPEVKAELLFASGTILTILGDFERAGEQLDEVLRIRQGADGSSAGGLVEALTAQASLRRNQGRLDEAQSLADRALHLARDELGSQDPRLADALGEKVSVLCELGEYGAAETPAKEILAIARQLPPGEWDILGLEVLGLIKNRRGEYSEAILLFGEALAKRRRLFGKNHPSQVIALNSLMVAHRRMEDFATAGTIGQELVDLLRENFGPDFANPAILSNLAGVRFGEGNYSAAEELYREALNSVLKSFGDEHWRVFLYEASIEMARIRGGDARGAEGRLRDLLALWTPRLGENQSRIAQARTLLGESLSLQDRCDEAEPWLVDGHRRLVENGAKYRQIADAFERLSDHLERCGRPEEIALYEGAAGPEPATP